MGGTSDRYEADDSRVRELMALERSFNWDIELAMAKKSLAEIFQDYQISLVARHTVFGGMSFHLTMRYGDLYEDRTVEVEDVEFSPWDLRETIAAALVESCREMQRVLWDPFGELKTISVKEVYADGRLTESHC